MDPTAQNNNDLNNQNPPSPQPGGPPPPNISATAIDPNDSLVNQAIQSAPPQDGPILPGQYIVAGQDSPSMEPTAPQSPQPAPIAPPTDPALASVQQTAAALAQQMPPAQPSTDLNSFAPTSSEMPPTPSTAFQEANTPPPSVPGSSQPDPTPYAPPPSAPGAAAPAPHDNGGSMIKKLRLVAIIIGVIVLLGVIGALVWFFVLGNNSNQPTKVENNDSAIPAIEPSPFPKRTEGGFDTLPSLPQSTSSAQQGTPAAIPQTIP